MAAASSIARLLLCASVCALWEALAKSLPDQGAFGKLAIRGCSTMRRWEWLLFYGFCRQTVGVRAAAPWFDGGGEEKMFGDGFLCVSAVKRWFDSAD